MGAHEQEHADSTGSKSTIAPLAVVSFSVALLAVAELITALVVPPASSGVNIGAGIAFGAVGSSVLAGLSAVAAARPDTPGYARVGLIAVTVLALLISVPLVGLVGVGILEELTSG